MKDQKNKNKIKISPSIRDRRETEGNRRLTHTRGYYRFSKTYPGKTDENGYRVNESPRLAPMSNRGRLTVYFAAVFCFILAFIITGAALNLSNREPPERAPGVTLTEEADPETEYEEPEDETGIPNEE